MTGGQASTQQRQQLLNHEAGRQAGGRADMSACRQPCSTDLHQVLKAIVRQAGLQRLQAGGAQLKGVHAVAARRRRQRQQAIPRAHICGSQQRSQGE